MSRVVLSVSQLLGTFGPGAMMDLPDRSVVVAGLDHWDNSKSAFKRIEEPRLTALLQAVLAAHDRWTPGKQVQLRTPPIADENTRESDPAGVSVRVFPTWFTCDGIVNAGTASERRRRLVRWTDLEIAGGRKNFSEMTARRPM